MLITLRASRNALRSVWRICMWILVLKGLKQAIEAHTARAYLGLSTVNRPFYQYGGHIEYKGVL